MADIEHGLSGYINGYCRCDVCTEANRLRHKEYREQRRALRVLVDGQLIAPLPSESHGKPATYSNHSCRCRECVRAWNERCVSVSRRYRQKRREAA